MGALYRFRTALWLALVAALVAATSSATTDPATTATATQANVDDPFESSQSPPGAASADTPDGFEGFNAPLPHPGLLPAYANVSFQSFEVQSGDCTVAHKLAHIRAVFPGGRAKVRRHDAPDVQDVDGAPGTWQHSHYGLTRLQCRGVTFDSHPATRKEDALLPGFIVPVTHAAAHPILHLGMTLEHGTSLHFAQPDRFSGILVLHVEPADTCPLAIRRMLAAGKSRVGGHTLRSKLAAPLDEQDPSTCTLQFLAPADQDWVPVGVYVDARTRRSIVGSVPVVFSDEELPVEALEMADARTAAPDENPEFRGHAATSEAISAAQRLLHAYIKSATDERYSNSLAAKAASADALLVEEGSGSSLLTLEDDNGQCPPDSFVEVDVQSIPGLDKMLGPIIDSVMTPVNDLLGGVLGSALGGSLSQSLGKAVSEGLTDEITAMLTHSLTPALTETLVPPLAETVTDQVTHSFSGSLRDAVTAKVAGPLADSLSKSISHSLEQSVPAGLESTLPPKVANRLSSTLSHILTRSVTQSVVPSLTNVMFHTPTQDYYCYYCFKYKHYCQYCHYSPTQLTQTVYYAAYYSAYYADYFAKHLTAGDDGVAPERQ